MLYAEVLGPAPLRHAIKLAWTLDVGGHGSTKVRHVATPDGCVEIIRRMHGRSEWRSEQPEQFVVGVSRQPAELRLSGDSRFIGVRVWPWAWNILGALPSPQLVDGWADLETAAPALRLVQTIEGAMQMIAARLTALRPDPLFDAILLSRSVSDLAERSGRSHRWLQRWFARNVGVPPRTYLRLLRFSATLDDLPSADGSLARHAAEHGFADQAHMSREFRSMTGASAKTARKGAVGPFL